MMHQAGMYRYFQGNGFQAVCLPYGSGRMAAYLFLPDEGTKWADFTAQFTSDHWNTWMPGFHEAQGNLGVPRFRSAYEANLQPPLSDLGMGIAFNAKRADFSKLAGNGPGDVWIGAARQKTYVEVNEQGTEAAAATGVVMQTRAARRVQTFKLTFDRPFLCVLQDSKTGAILFLGEIVDPAAGA
jgi:serpin B